MEVTLNSANFDKEVLEHKGYVLVDFWASWCGPCKMVAPIVAEIAEEGEVKVCKVDVDENMALAQRYQVVSIPTLLLFRDGKLVNQSIGFAPKSEITKMWK